MYDWSLAAKKMVAREFFISAVSGSGTERHKPLLRAAVKGELGGAFCLTEISHGTNTKAVRTTATYQPDTGKFLLHTPDFEAAKCWAGNLAKTATHAAVFAQLHCGGECHGLHTFIVPVRDPATLLPLPGVIIGDMGAKVGLNGLDNGWMMLDKYELDREMLLNKTGDVTPEGVYTTPFKDPKKRFGASLGNLSGGRVGIINMANCNLHMAVVIAVRYSAVRRQFGAPGQEEQAVLNYPTQQHRLMPYLAASFAHHHFSMTFYEDFLRLLIGKMSGEDPDMLAALGMEVHGVSSAGKPLFSWTAQAAVQECREACGGHGYLAAARLGQLRDDNDANTTYEGDNTVLLQQTSQWLLGAWRQGGATPAGSLDWLAGWREGGGRGEVTTTEGALAALRALVVRLLGQTEREVARLREGGLDAFSAKNRSQVHLAKTLSLVFIRSVVVARFHVLAQEQATAHPVLPAMARLYACWSLEQHEADLAIHGLLQPHDLARVRDAVLQQCHDLVPEAVLLTDVLAPPDFILNSVLGHSSGKVYQQIQQAFLAVPGGFERADFWQDYTHNYRNKAKL